MKLSAFFCNSLIVWQLGDEIIRLLLQLLLSWQLVQLLLQLTLNLRDHSNGIADVALDLRDEKKKLLNAVLDNLRVVATKALIEGTLFLDNLCDGLSCPQSHSGELRDDVDPGASFIVLCAL